MVPTVIRSHGRLALIAVLACLTLAYAAPRVFAVGGGIAESTGLRDASDNVRARVGAQTDGKYGLRVWDGSGTLLYDLTNGAPALGGAPRVATSVTGLGTGMKDGEPGYLRLGTGSANSVPVVWDETRSKWVTTPQPLVEMDDDQTTTSSSYASIAGTYSERRAIPGYKNLYDAGLRPEVYVQSYMRTGGSGSVEARVAIGEIANGGTTSSRVAVGGEVSTTEGGANSALKYSGWTPLTIESAPTQDYAFGYFQAKATSTGYLTGGTTSAQIRWAG